MSTSGSPAERSDSPPLLSAQSQSILASLLGMPSPAAASQGSRGSSIVDLSSLSLAQIMQLLRSTATRGGEEESDNEGWYDEDEDEDDYYNSSHHTPWLAPASEPQKAGVRLLKNGEFGNVSVKIRSRRQSNNLARNILARHSKPVPNSRPEDIHSSLTPNTNGTTVATYDANMYTAQFSTDSSFFYTCAQDFKMHIFDMTLPPGEPRVASEPLRTRGRNFEYVDGLRTRLAVRKTIQGHPGRWTVTDANLSPDNERMIYSSITPTVYMTSTSPDGSNVQTPIPFSDPVSRRPGAWGESRQSFGIWSCRFSADGNEVVAGGSGNIFVYDLLAERRTVKIDAHNDDVNSCCWADTASGNVLISASDDTFIKVWDRRSLGMSARPSGVLIGHTEGITYVSAKGDGRYVISNGKDQAIRLWDLRKMRSNAEFEAVEGHHYGVRHFDYRYPPYPKPRRAAHPQDCSVMTYRGHSVLRTLIRCHFSPMETTGAQYIYSGSVDGRIHIWSLDGTVVDILDRSKTLPISFDASGPEPAPADGGTRCCVRDLSWHSHEPVILSAAWSNDRTIIARHEYKGLSKMLGSLETWTERRRLHDEERSTQRQSSMRTGLSFARGSARRGSEPEDELELDEEDDEDYEYSGSELDDGELDEGDLF